MFDDDPYAAYDEGSAHEWFESDDSARHVPEGAELRNAAGPCCECGRHHEGYEPDGTSPCGHYHSEPCPNS